MERKDKTIVVFGGSSGIGRATALQAAASGARVIAVGRDAGKLEQTRALLGERGEVVAGDATEQAFVDSLLQRFDPDIVICALGTHPRLAPIEEHDWASFSSAWETDTKASFLIGTAALRKPLRPGSAVLFVSSGAALNGSPLSGGYAGAKRMQWFLGGYLRQRAATLGRQIRFHVVLPGQLVVGTEIGEMAATAYGEGQGGRDAFLSRWPKPLTADAVATGILSALDEAHANTLAHRIDGEGIHAC